MSKYIHVPSNIGIGLLGFNFSLGSDFETQGELGTHHLMEHLVPKFFDDLRPKMKRLGIEYNALTAPDRITFYFTGLDENLGIIAQEVYERVTCGEYAWSLDAFKNEKRTILQEYEDVFNEQMNGALTNLFRKHYNYFGPVGLKRDIKNFSYNKALAFRKRFKEPDIICEVGWSNLAHQKTATQPTHIQKPVFGTYKTPQEKVPREGKTLVGLMGRNTIPKSEQNRVHLVLDCLNDGLESPLYQEIRELRGLSYCSNGFLYPILGVNVATFCATTSKKERKSLRAVYREFFSGDLSRHMTQDRFDDCYSSIMINKAIYERLPHDGAIVTVLQDSPFEGLEDFNYPEAIATLEKHFQFEEFEEIEY